jgi:hypothetical protein
MAIVTEELWTKRDFVDLARRQQQFVRVFLLIGEELFRIVQSQARASELIH